MGLFSFLKNAGAKIFNKKDEVPTPDANDMAAMEVANRQKAILLRGIVDGLQIEVENFDVVVNNDEVTVYGQTESQADKEKIILAVGNVHGVATVDDRISVVTPAPEASFYEVKSGDSLSKIAKEQYGDAMKYMLIFEANQPMLTDPNKIYPGQVLRIPAI